MKVKILLILFLFFNLYCIYSQEKSPLNDIQQYVVRIYHNEQQVGTGFSYQEGDKKYIVTNYHVVEQHIENLQKNDTTSKIYFLPTFSPKSYENGAYVSKSNVENSRRFVQFKKVLSVPDKIKSSGKIQNYARSVDLIVLNRKEKDTLILGTLKSFESTKLPKAGAEIYCASFPLSSRHLNLSRGISSKMIFDFFNGDRKKEQELRKQGFETTPFYGCGDYVATSGSSGAPVFMIDEFSKKKILVGINKSTFNPYGQLLQKYARKYKYKLDSIGVAFDHNRKSHTEIMEKCILFSNVGVSTIGVNQFASTQSLWFLTYLLEHN